jgi:hypothetical protein
LVEPEKEMIPNAQVNLGAEEGILNQNTDDAFDQKIGQEGEGSDLVGQQAESSS